MLPPNLASAERATRRRLPTTSRASAWRPDPPAERHPRAELDALHPDLIDQAVKQPQPPSWPLSQSVVGGGWGGWAGPWSTTVASTHRPRTQTATWTGSPPRDPYRIALVAASSRARTSSFAIGGGTSRRASRAARRRPASWAGRRGSSAPWNTPSGEQAPVRVVRLASSPLTGSGYREQAGAGYRRVGVGSPRGRPPASHRPPRPQPAPRAGAGTAGSHPHGCCQGRAQLGVPPPRRPMPVDTRRADQQKRARKQVREHGHKQQHDGLGQGEAHHRHLGLLCLLVIWAASS